MRDRGTAELRAGQRCGRRLSPQGLREYRAVWARRGESGALQEGCVCAGPERCAMPRAQGRLAEGSGGAAAAALRHAWGQCMRGRGNGDTAPLEEAAAAGPRRCGERRVRGGERPRGSRGGGAFVPRGPNKGAAGPGRAGRGGEAAGAVPGAGGGARLSGSGPGEERPPAGRARKESGDPERAGRGCEKGCEAGRPRAPCACPDRVHGCVTQSILPGKSASGRGEIAGVGSRSLGGSELAVSRASAPAIARRRTAAPFCSARSQPAALPASSGMPSKTR